VTPGKGEQLRGGDERPERSTADESNKEESIRAIYHWPIIIATLTRDQPDCDLRTGDECGASHRPLRYHSARDDQ
jgi:hypothetical protein